MFVCVRAASECMWLGLTGPFRLDRKDRFSAGWYGVLHRIVAGATGFD